MKKIKKLLVSVFTALVLFVASFSCLFNGNVKTAKAYGIDIDLYFSDLQQPLLSNYSARRFTKDKLEPLISYGSADHLVDSEDYIHDSNDPYGNTPPKIVHNTWIVIEALFSITPINAHNLISLISSFNSQLCSVWVITLDTVQSVLDPLFVTNPTLSYRCNYINLNTTYREAMQEFGEYVAIDIGNNYLAHQHTDTSPFIADGRFIEKMPYAPADDYDYALGMTLDYAQSHSYLINSLLNTSKDRGDPFTGTDSLWGSSPYHFSLYVYHDFLDNGSSISTPYTQLPDMGNEQPMAFETILNNSNSPLYFASFTPFTSYFYNTMKDYQIGHINQTDYANPYTMIIGAIEFSPDGLVLNAYYPTREEIDEETIMLLDEIAENPYITTATI